MQVLLYKHLFLWYYNVIITHKELAYMVIFHIDVNNAYLSWEAVYRLAELKEPLDLRKIPAVIGGDEKNRHGIVLAKSMPAKAFGIQTAETLVEARKKCPNLQVIPPTTSTKYFQRN